MLIKTGHSLLTYSFAVSILPFNSETSTVMFAITGFRYLEALFHIFYHMLWGKENRSFAWTSGDSLYRGSTVQ